MITVYNANNLAQQWFFQRAYAHLEAEGLLKDEFKNPNGLFLSLESYFANIGTLINLKTEYAMIPSDEEPFEINANTRAIKIPAAFAKGVAIAGDDMSEVITFTIDRYFDYVDLAGTNICVQWELPGENGGTGISHITLIDLETMPGKIRFGWPLTEKLTQYAGKVNFAVRFFVENKAQTEHNPSPYDYVFNTSPAVVTILPGMNIVDPTFSEVNIKGEFNKFVQNSQNPALPKADSPFWTDYREVGGVGKDLRLDSPAAIDLDSDELILKAQALVNGNGYIDYKWYFKQGGIDSDYPVVEILASDERYEIKNDVYEEVEIPEDGQRVINEQYYVHDPDKGADAYKLFIGPVLTAAEGPFYERFTTLRIKPRNGNEDPIYRDVTGAYWVEAAHYVGAKPIELDPENPDLGSLPPINQSTPSRSSDCIVPTPAPVTLTAEPAQTVFSTQDHIAKSSVILEVTPSVDAGNPARFYTWYKNDSDPDTILDDSIEKVTKVGDAQSLVLTKGDEKTVPAGWYYVNVDSQLNRAIESKKSTYAYRVTEEPQITELITEYCVWTSVMDSTNEEIIDFLENPDNWNAIPANGLQPDAFTKGDLVRLRVRPKIKETLVEDLYVDDILIDNLLTDDISYRWYIIPVDDPNVSDEVGTILDEQTINDFSDVNNNGYIKWGTPLHSNYLDIWCVSNTFPITSYYCVVTNTLADKKAEFTLGDYENLFTIW